MVNSKRQPRPLVSSSSSSSSSCQEAEFHLPSLCPRKNPKRTRTQQVIEWTRNCWHVFGKDLYLSTCPRSACEWNWESITEGGMPWKDQHNMLSPTSLRYSGKGLKNSTSGWHAHRSHMQVRYYLTSWTLERRSEPRERLFLAGCWMHRRACEACSCEAIAPIPDCRLIETAMVWKQHLHSLF